MDLGYVLNISDMSHWQVCLSCLLYSFIVIAWYVAALRIHNEIYQPTSFATGRPHPQTPATGPHLDGLLACIFPWTAGAKSVCPLSLSLRIVRNMKILKICASLFFAGVKGGYSTSHRDTRNALSSHQKT